MLLEPRIGFDLIERLSDNFSYAFGIVYTPFAAVTMLSPSENKFGQHLKDLSLRYHASSFDVHGLQSDAFSTEFFLGSRVSHRLKVVAMPCLY